MWVLGLFHTDQEYITSNEIFLLNKKGPVFTGPFYGYSKVLQK